MRLMPHLVVGGHIPFCPEVKVMPSFEWLKIKEGKTSGYPKTIQGIPQSFLSCLIKKNAVRCQDGFRMGFQGRRKEFFKGGSF